MTDQQSDTDTVDLEARGSSTSKRRRTPLRRLYYYLGLAALKGAVRLIWWTYRIDKIIGADIADRIRDSETPTIPCVWHGQLVLGIRLVYGWVHSTGYKACFIVSASVDGDAPSQLGEDWGAHVIRGSANSSGAHVLRDAKRKIRDGYSIVTAADGPTGPNKVFKEGIALMSKVAGVPMVPMAFAADRAWYLHRWDNFMIPKPFARIAMAFGEPVCVPKSAKVRDLETWRMQMENAVNVLGERSNDVFKGNPEQ